MVSNSPPVPPEPSVGSDRTGLMIIRAWLEEGSPAPLRVQIRVTTDVSEGFERTTNLRDVKAAAAAVEDWLTDMLANRRVGEHAFGSEGRSDVAR